MVFGSRSNKTSDLYIKNLNSNHFLTMFNGYVKNLPSSSISILQCVMRFDYVITHPPSQSQLGQREENWSEKRIPSREGSCF
jgi:hypothetical protein